MLIQTLKLKRIISLMMVSSLFLFAFLPNVVAQQENICRDANVPTIDYDETVVGAVSPQSPVIFYCFEAERGTDITVTIAPASANLLTTFIVGTPFFTVTEGFEDAPLLEEVASSPGSAYQGTTTIDSDGTYLILVSNLQDTQGQFTITLEESGGSVLGATTTTDDDEASEDSSESANTSTGTGIANIVPGETDLCTTIFAEEVSYDEAIETALPDGEFRFFCFEAAESDIVTIDVTTEDAEVQFAIVEPLFDFTQRSVIYTGGAASVPDEPASTEFVAPEAGTYVLLFVAESTANLSATISVTAGNIYSCDNEPLSTLISAQWGVLDANGEPIITVNVTCDERIIVRTLGQSTIGNYDITQTDQLIFSYNDFIFATSDLDEEQWVFFNNDTLEEFTLEPISEAGACSEGDLATLIQGSWEWDLGSGAPVVLDFTCNGVVLVNNQSEPPFEASYELDGDTLSLFGSVQPIDFESVVITEANITAIVEETEFILDNALAPSEADE